MQVALVGLPGFFHALHLLALVYLPLFFLLVRHFPSFFRRSSDSVASPFHSVTGSPFGPSPFLFNLCTPHSLVFARLSTFLYVFVLLVLFRSFYSLRSIIFTSYHLGVFLPSSGLFLVSVLHSLSIPRPYLLLPSRGFPSFPLALFLTAVPHGSSSFWWPFSSSPLGLALLFIGYFFTCWVPYLSLVVSPPVGFPFRASSACSSSWPRTVMSLRSSGSPPL